MKKIVILLLILSIMLTLAACDNADEQLSFAPIAEYQQMYIDAKPLDGNKLNYFQRQLMTGSDASDALWGFMLSEKCDYEFTMNKSGRLAFIEGVMIAENEYVLVTQDMLVEYTPVALHFKWENDKMTMMDISLVTTNPNLDEADT